MNFFGSLNKFNNKAFLNKNLGSSHRYTLLCLAVTRSAENSFRLSLLRGFSLAEVLIALGIIGVVAGMTIPGLINNINEAQYKSAAKKAFSVSSSAVGQMREDEGGTLNYYKTTNLSFKPVFMTYFKVIKDYRWTDYRPITSSAVAPDIYKTLTGTQADGFRADDGQFVTSDGFFFGIDNYMAPILITVDVNGTKQPNTYGKDTFVFEIVGENLLPMGAKGTSFTAASNCNRTTDNSHQGWGCMSLVMQGIDY